MTQVVPSPTGAPALEADIALRDGSTVHMRPTRAGDEPAILAFLGGLSDESRYFRFFSGAPLSDLDAHEMVRSLKTFPLLDGYRGAPLVDVAALEDVMLRISALVEDHAEIAELDCNPVMVGQHGAVVVDARVRLEMPLPRRPIGAR